MTWYDLRQKADKHYADLAKLKRLKKQQVQLSKQLYYAKGEVKRLQQLVVESEAKLTKFERDHFMNRIKKWFINWEEQLSEQEQVIVHTKLKYEEARVFCEQLSDEYNVIEQQLATLNELELEAKITVVKLQMESWLATHHVEKAKQLQKLTLKLQNAEKMLVEIKQAHHAGDEAMQSLNDAYEALKEAKGFSYWDTLGGGILVTGLKHEKMDTGNAHLQSAQWKLQQFQNELLDIDELPHQHLQVSTTGFVKFADYFFDGIFSALHVGAKIDEAKTYTRKAIHDVSIVLERVIAKEIQTQNLISELKEEIEKIYKTNEQPLNL